MSDLDVSALASRRVLIGVCGGIAAYKVAWVVSRLAQAGADVHVLMTESATRFVTPLTFESLSGNAVQTSPWQQIDAHDPQHIARADATDIALIAPCSMDCLARLATGRTDDVVTLVLSAINRDKTPVLLAPSMNTVMLSQPATQRNLQTLREDGFSIIEPGSGWQACRHVGPGRLPEPETLLATLAEVLANRLA